MRAVGLWAVSALAACTYPEKELSTPFGCLGDPPPTTAASIVNLQGVVVEASQQAPLADVSVRLLDRNMSPITGPLTTDASGRASFSLTTGGVPVERVYLSATATGRVTTFQTNVRHIADDVVIAIGLASTIQRDALATGALGRPFTPGTGVVLLFVTDCNDKRLANATLTSVPAGDVRYFEGVMPSITATATDAAGVAMVANLPPGMVTLTATVDGMTFPSRSFLVVVDAFVQTVMVP